MAIAASLVLHALLAAVFFRLRPAFLRPIQPPPETVSVRQVLRLTKKPPKRPPPPAVAKTVIARRQQPPAPHAVAVQAPPVLRSRPRPRELAKFAPNAPPQPPRAPEVGKPASPGKHIAARPQLSGQQLAQIQNDLSASISADRSAIDPLHVPPGPGPETKHYTPDFSTLETGDRRGRGLCDPVKSWTESGWDYYYVACNVRFDDGTYERQGVPWPVRFNPSDDPFNGSAREERPLAMPLPGWHLGADETASVQLRAYAKAHGVDL